MPNRTDLPYKGLAHYEEQNQELFAGRDVEVNDCADLILHSSTSVFVLHGMSGCGKSSFIRAGVIPFLKREGQKPTGTVRLLVVSPQEASTEGPLYSLACGVYDAAAAIGAAEGTVAEIAKNNRHYFASSHASDAYRIYDALVSITLATSRLPIFFVDQVEQILYGELGSPEKGAPFLALMARLCKQQVDVRICVAMRSEYKARFDDQIRGAKPFALAGFYLREMAQEPLKQAIERPTDFFNFRFGPDAVKTILEKLTLEEGVIGGPLVATQVMCDRLYRTALTKMQPDEDRAMIKREEVLALGDPNDQIVFHIQESLYAAFRLKQLTDDGSSRTREAARADRWLQKLATLVISTPDGRARSGCTTLSALTPQGEEQDEAKNIIERLCSPDEYVLRVDSSGQYCLRHDSIALALRRWREANRTIATQRGTRRRRVLAATAYGDKDQPLWIDKLYPKPNVLRLATLDDAIWDHLLLLFAKQQGFADRIGIDLAVEGPAFSGPLQPDDNLYSTFFDSPEPKIAIIPIEIIQVPDTYQHIAVTNVFRGYALTGPKVEKISRHADVQAFDRFSEKFANEILPLICEEEPPPVKLFPEQKKAGDSFYYWLMGDTSRFGIGPAPTRARWKQTGQFKEWDRESSMKFLIPEVNQKMAALSMHEICVVSAVPEVWKYRIAGLIFYTVQFILTNPSEFVRYLFDYEWAIRRGGIPVSRDAIQETVAASYLYTTFEAYLSDYLCATSEDFVRDNGINRSICRQQLLSVFSQISAYRSKYDSMLLKVEVRAKDNPVVMQLLVAAARHYAIYNFYDACELLGMALELLRKE